MPGRSDSDEMDDDGRRRNPRRGSQDKPKIEIEDLGYASETDDEQSEQQQERPQRKKRQKDDEDVSPPESEDDEDLDDADVIDENDDDDDDDGDYDQKPAARQKAPKENAKTSATRKSSRSTKFTSSMEDPNMSDSFMDSDEATEEGSAPRKAKKKTRGKSSDDGVDTDSENSVASAESDFNPSGKKKSKKKKKDSNSNSNSNNKSKNNSNDKSKGSTKNKSKAKKTQKGSKRPRRRKDDSDDDDSDDYEYSDSNDESEPTDGNDENDGSEDVKIQRILATRSETQSNWKEICSKMNTSEITEGSRWYQAEEESPDAKSKEETAMANETLQERFLVKWSGLSYMHVSWETQKDLIEEIEGAKTYFSTFFRKAQNGILFPPDERCDGDYFDPAYVEIDRILEVHFDDVQNDDDGSNSERKRVQVPTTVEEEESIDPVKRFRICVDRASPKFDSGVGRQFLVKWKGFGYSDIVWEFERDLIINDVEYMSPLKHLYSRIHKPSKKAWRAKLKDGEEAKRKTYKVFGDSVQRQESLVKQYQKRLQDRVYPNGGQLRDYQAEGVSWMIANYANSRSCILADEMGLGKTLQTVSFVNLLVTEMCRPGPFLVVVPLSTLTHWQREFETWSGLNTIVYHGSAEDRQKMREYEFVYPIDQPDFSSMGVNSSFLKKAANKAKSSFSPCWMIQVVITTPEIMVTDDASELSHVAWDCLIVDEAHRLKNHGSKLSVSLRSSSFNFRHKILLTGTPIQNDVEEFWSLLNFIDPANYGTLSAFMNTYGDMKSKEKIDQLHDNIRPYILRRLKEDVEKSVPPKEETLIEVELTTTQKQYYRALYEKNIKFLHKNKKKPLDGPSLNNLAMQLRKVCNHLFLLNGVEEELRNQLKSEKLSESDFLVRGSGKFVLLDKLLPRLKENGHRILLFSQFKIMLDVLEDYLHVREWKFERIDGSVTGKRRQQAIDRFQDQESKDPPFVMLLSTRAGGVGINLTAADTCIIFDSDWNPQNDLQAQARCHRIGQTKSVKVYRLLSRKSYEMQMFHMSSLKMGLDQAVLKGFESNASDSGGMTKDEVERLLRHGAYDIFNEEKAGSAEAESNAFVEQDIDSILERRSKTVVHANTGTQSNAKGGTFSKASFVAPKATDGKRGPTEDVDIEDPDFWTKMVGNAVEEETDILKPRKRQRTNYSETYYHKRIEEALGVDDDSSAVASDGSADMDDNDSSAEDESELERSRWGGTKPNQWRKAQASDLLKALEKYGYGNMPWEDFRDRVPALATHSVAEIHRMAWSMLLITLLEVAREDAIHSFHRSKKRQLETEETKDGEDAPGPSMIDDKGTVNPDAIQAACADIMKSNEDWIHQVFSDANAFVKSNDPRHHDGSLQARHNELIQSTFQSAVWPALEMRGWQMQDNDDDGMQYTYKDKESGAEKKFNSARDALHQIGGIHQELAATANVVIMNLETARLKEVARMEAEKLRLSSLSVATALCDDMKVILQKYSPLQLMNDRRQSTRLPLAKRLLVNCFHMNAVVFIARPGSSENLLSAEDIARRLCVDYRTNPPHPLWTNKHDGVLIHSIAKHGWVDKTEVCAAIVADKEIKWGMPFDKSDYEDEMAKKAKQQKLNTDTLKSLRTSADRACQFMNGNIELLTETKAFNQKVVIQAYGLKEVEAENDAADPGAKPLPQWAVDDAMLRQVNKCGKDADAADEIIDLPAKRELVKRAKAVLLKTIHTLKHSNNDSSAITGTAPTAATGDTSEKEVAAPKTAKQAETYGYATLDATNPTFTFLIEFIRGLNKFSMTKKPKQGRMLCSMAYEEALALQEYYKANGDETGQVEHMGKIADQIALVKRSLKSSARPGKNVLRVMLGMDVVQPRNEGDKMFPSDEPDEPSKKPTVAKLLQAQTEMERQAEIETETEAEAEVEVDEVQTNAKSKAKKSGRSRDSSSLSKKYIREDNAAGDRAIFRAMERAQTKYKNQPFRFTSSEQEETELQLTMIETLMLYTFCIEGIPLAYWEGETNQKRHSKYDLYDVTTWQTIANMLAMGSWDFHQSSVQRLEKMEAQYEKTKTQNARTADLDKLKRRVDLCRHDMEMKEDAAKSAQGFASEPVKLGKKSIMLLEKLRKWGGTVTSTPKNAYKVEGGLGPRVSQWFGKELARSAAQMDILDNTGAPLSFTTKELIESHPEFQRFAVASLFDKKCCRAVISQIAMPTRARSLFLKYDELQMQSKVTLAVMRSRKVGDVWDRKPDWWDGDSGEGVLSTKNDFLLLQRLVQFGFFNIQMQVDGFGPLPSSDSDSQEGGLSTRKLKDWGLTKIAIQNRTNQLVRELNAEEEAEETKRLLKQRRSKSKQRKSMDSLAGVRGAGAKKSARNADGSTIVQAGLHAFFQSANSAHKRQPIIEVLSDDEPDQYATSSKRRKVAAAAAPNTELITTDAVASVDADRKVPARG